LWPIKEDHKHHKQTNQPTLIGTHQGFFDETLASFIKQSTQPEESKPKVGHKGANQSPLSSRAPTSCKKHIREGNLKKQ
jgi:hypothetical protein